MSRVAGVRRAAVAVGRFLFVGLRELGLFWTASSVYYQASVFSADLDDIFRGVDQMLREEAGARGHGISEPPSSDLG